MTTPRIHAGGLVRCLASRARPDARHPGRTSFSARRVGLALGAALASAGAAASDLDNLQVLDQAQFLALSRDLGAALSFKPLIPSESLGLTGIDLGVGVTATRLVNERVWAAATNDDDIPNYLPIPTLRAHKGLPFGIDVGATYAGVPGTNLKLWGAELRWAFVEGNAAVPAVAIRGSYSRLFGVDQLDARTSGIDLSISKGFLMLTPYAGIGHVWVTSTPKVGNLARESFGMNKAFAGLNVNLGLVNLDFEADRTGKANSYGIKVGFRF